MKNAQPRVERGFTKLIIPCKNGGLVTSWPSKGPKTYSKVGNEVLNENLLLQTGYQTSLLARVAYGREEPEFQDVKSIIYKSWLWVYQVNFWLPEKDKDSGMYSVYDFKALGRNMKFNREELEAKLEGAEVYEGVRFNRGKGVAFAPRSTIYLGQEKDWDKFAKNGLNVAIFTPEGAKNLAELGRNNFSNGYGCGVSGNDSVETRVSALYGVLDSGGLGVSGDCWGDVGVGHAFGVRVAD